ncbi:MAG TPA: hypothetical protein VMU48_10720 [Terracidiphilus sp.]|nr:hypothetical protein [Terracidiphilus sp.]
MRDIGNCTALLSGSETAADELLTLCEKPVLTFSVTPSAAGSDQVVTDFLRELRNVAAERKRVLIDHHLKMNCGLSFNDFLDKHRDKMAEFHSRDIWNQINHIDLDADVIICGISNDEPVIIRLDRFGKTHWETNYSVIGTGADIALSFLCQREWSGDDELIGNNPGGLQVMECLYRLYEAKRAAQANRHVGMSTTFLILLEGGKRLDITQSTFEKFKEVYQQRLALPKFEFSPDMLESADEEDGEKGVSSKSEQEAAAAQPGDASAEQSSGSSTIGPEGSDSAPSSGVPGDSSQQS